MPVPTYTTICTARRRLSAVAFEVALQMSPGMHFTFQAGQFVLLDVPRLSVLTDIQPRAYSMSLPPSEDTLLTFVVEDKPEGRAARWVAEGLKVGDSVTMRGPLGHFTLRSTNPKPYVFVATGTGVGPFRSQIRDSLERQGDRRPMQLFFGVRHEEDLFWVEEFRALERSFPNFRACVSLSRPPTKWVGLRGRLTEVIPEHVANFASIQAYVCGSPDMVREVREWFLTQGTSKEDVHIEGYI